MKKAIIYVILFLGLNQIQAQDILVLQGGQSSQLSQAQGFADNLNATGVFNSVDAAIWDALDKYDLDYLNAYDAVMVLTNGGYNPSFGMGDLLKTYVDNGGGVGIFLFANGSIQIGGAWDYNALLPSGQSMGPTNFGTIDIPTHPALNYPFTINTATWNVGSLWSSTSNTLAPEAYSIAKFSDGRPGLQARENVGVNGLGRVIDFAVYPAAASGSNTVQGYQLFANIMMWLTGSIQTSGDTCLATNSVSFSFQDDGGSPVVDYNWDFGDTTSSTLATPNKTYTIAGEFDITLTVVRQDASSNTYTDKVVISDNPTTANAGDDIYLISGTATAQLIGNVVNVGEGDWSLISGPNTPTATMTDNILDLSNLIAGTYEYEWKITNGTCQPSTDLIQILIADNTAPTDMAITSVEITENNEIGDAVGVLSANDADIDDTHTYSLVAGSGAEDNASFTIVDAELQAGANYDYETKNSYSIRVRATDRFGEFFEKSFEITILNTDDEDIDNDGQADADEIACGSDPLDNTSISLDTDSDNSPDCVDTDDDNDGIPDTSDNCIITANADQLDTDSDGEGDACDTDDDNDGIPDSEDPNPLLDTQTTQPQLNAPLGNTISYDQLEVEFVIPEDPLANSISLTFTSGEDPNSPIVLELDDSVVVPELPTSFVWDISQDVTALPEVLSATHSTLVNGASYDVTLSYQDAEGNPAETATNSNYTIVTELLLTSLAISSDNSSPKWAKEGDRVIFDFSFNRPVDSAFLQYFGTVLAFTSDPNNGSAYQGWIEVGPDTEEGVVNFTLTANGGAYNLEVTTTTDGSTVTVDTTAPEPSLIIDESLYLGPFDIQLQFSEPVENIAPSPISLVPDDGQPTANLGAIEVVTPGLTYRISVTPLIPGELVFFNDLTDIARDRAGNPSVPLGFVDGTFYDLDTDGDGEGNNTDADDDGDGTPDTDDAFPLDDTESTDTDGDGDGTQDEDAFPLDASKNLTEGNSIDDVSLLVPAEAFTPNGDGNNDTWVIPGIDNYSNAKITVYNRWGHEVFAAINYRNDWNGSRGSNSSKLPAGSYLYVIDLGNDSPPLRGWLFINY